MSWIDNKKANDMVLRTENVQNIQEDHVRIYSQDIGMEFGMKNVSCR